MLLKNFIKYCLSLLLVMVLLLSCSKNNSSTGLPAITASNDKSTGASSRDLLTASAFSSVKIEIQYMKGYAPDASALSNLVSFLNSIINKPNGITISRTEIVAKGQATYSLNDIATIEQKNRTAYNSASQLAIYILIVDGNYSEAGVLGVSYRNTSVCLMGKTLSDNSGGIGQVNATKLQTTVDEHEFGHLLGLVDLSTPMVTNHKDAAHGNHCNNQNCLMYYQAETTDLLGFLQTGNIPALDANCLNDLKANGGK